MQYFVLYITFHRCFGEFTGFVTRLTQRVALVEHELLTLLEHLSTPTVLVGSCYSIFSFMCMFSRSLFVLLAIVLSRLLITLLISSNSSHPSGASQFNHCFSWVPITRSYFLCVCFIDRCLYVFFWSLYCLSFDLRILITPFSIFNSLFTSQNI